MAKKHYMLLFATFILSCISLPLLIVSISTENWLNGSARNTNATGNSEINYGLFSGTLIRHILSTPQKFDLTLTCDYSQGACMYSCQMTAEKRQEELQKILNGQITDPCPLLIKTKMVSDALEEKLSYTTLRDGDPKPSDQYIRAGFWLSTVIFLAIAIAFTTISAASSAINLVYNPIEQIFNTFGIYIWNGISALATLITIIIWASLYEQSLKFNIAITDTLQSLLTFESNGLASNDFSFYLLIAPLILNLGNVGLLAWRNHLMQYDDEPPARKSFNDSPLEFF